MARRYSEFEIASTLNRLRRGEPLSALAKLHDIPERTIRRWAHTFHNLTAAEIREARALRAENRRLLVRIRCLRCSSTGDRRYPAVEPIVRPADLADCTDEPFRPARTLETSGA